MNPLEIIKKGVDNILKTGSLGINPPTTANSTSPLAFKLQPQPLNLNAKSVVQALPAQTWTTKSPQQQVSEVNLGIRMNTTPTLNKNKNPLTFNPGTAFLPKGTKLQAQTGKEKLPTYFQKIGMNFQGNIDKILNGDPLAKEQSQQVEKNLGIKPTYPQELLNEGVPRFAIGILASSLNETDQEKAKNRYDALLDSGINTDRATKIAIADVKNKMDRANMGDTSGVDDYNALNVTPEENKALRWTKVKELGSLALDVVGNVPMTFGSLKFLKPFAKTIAETQDLNVITRELIDSGVPQNVANKVAGEFVNINDEIKVANKISRIAEDIKTNPTLYSEKVPAKVLPTANKPKLIQNIIEGNAKLPEKKVADPLVAEAKKYKSAEEFVKAHEQSDLMDLSDRNKHRFGRIWNETGEGIQDLTDISKQYSKDLKYTPDANVPIVLNPEQTVTIFRSVPKGIKDIEAGDYVSFSKNYAASHERGGLIKLEVPAKDVIWQGNDFNEWVYSPQKIRKQYPNGLKDVWKEANTIKTPISKPEIKLTGERAKKVDDLQKQFDEVDQKGFETGWMRDQQKDFIDNLSERYETVDLDRFKRLENKGQDFGSSNRGARGTAFNKVGRQLEDLTGVGAVDGKLEDEVADEVRDLIAKKQSFRQENARANQEIKQIEAEKKALQNQIKEIEKTQRLEDTSNLIENKFFQKNADRTAELQRKSADKVERAEIKGQNKIDEKQARVWAKENAKKDFSMQVAKSFKEPASISRQRIDKLLEFKNRAIEFVQDSEYRVKKLLERKDVEVNDANNIYQKSTLYSGKVDFKIKSAKLEVKEILGEADTLAKNNNLKLADIRKDVNEFLIARHTPERNVALGKGASGMTDEKAAEVIKRISESKNGKEVIKIAEKIQTMNNKTLQILKDGGVITDDLLKSLREKYKNHVPLNRILETTDDFTGALSAKGYDVKSTGIKKAVGSNLEVDDILGNVVNNYEQAIIRAEKNLVDNATLQFVKDNQDALGDLMIIRKPKMVGMDLKGNPILETTTSENIIQLFENGKKIWIEVKDKNLAIALKSVGNEPIGTMLNIVASFTRFYSGLMTRFNPEFAFPNKIRDLQETMVYMASQKEITKGAVLKTATKDLTSIKSVLDAIRGKDSEGAILYKEMQSAGGTTGGMGLSTRKQTELDIKKIEGLFNSKTKNIANNLVEYVDNWNTIFEDSTRLSVYKQALESGASKDRAAFLAKEASINFNRRGNGGAAINAMYMFANASIQGSAKMIRAMRNPKVAATVVTAVGTSVVAVNKWNEKVDPEWKSKVPKWDLMNGLNIVLPAEDGKFRYFTVPVSWGMKPIKIMSEYTYDATNGVKHDTKEILNTFITSILESYNPVGGTDIVSAISPTLLDIPSEIARNKSWTGAMIKPDYDKNKPEYAKYYDSLAKTTLGQTAIDIASMADKNLGIAISPADLKYAFDGYIGGAGKFVGKMFNFGVSLFDSKPIPKDEYPFISRFYRERTAEEIRKSDAYDAKNTYDKEVGRIKQEMKDTIQPIYLEQKKLYEQGEFEKGDALYDNLSDYDKDIFNQLEKATLQKEKTLNKTLLVGVYEKQQKLYSAGKIEEGDKIYDDLSDDEKKLFNSIEKKYGEISLSDE